MKFLRLAYYELRQGFRNILRNLFMVFASVIVVFSVLLISGLMIEAGITLGSVIRQFGDRAEVQINLSYLVSDEEAQEYFEVIKSDSRVKDAQFISKDENLERIIAYFHGDEDLFEKYRESERLHFASIEVQLNEYADGESFLEEVKGLDGVDSVKDIVGTIEKMQLIRFWVNIGTIIAVIFMTLLSILLIFNTVKLTILARKNEIEIMKYIGATDIYIAVPFVIEGVFTGIVGSLLAFLALSGIYSAVYKGVYDTAISANIVPLTFKETGAGWIFLAFLIFGIVTGFVASVWASKKHMKV
ncbi:MAG: ABC transporter permease [Clostridia bacterium]|nr:ABC transporter permease [Clostridia bacterium]MBO7658537.1 ABC transporter permease [Clostridia bacterium]